MAQRGWYPDAGASGDWRYSDQLTSLIGTVINVAMSYQRNQIVWAIARCLVKKPQAEDEHKVRIRVQRLLDSDRELEVGDRTEGNSFLEGDRPGKGSEMAFEAADGFVLLLAVVLLDTGLTQSRVVRLMRALGPRFRAQFDWLSTFTPADLRKGRDRAKWRKDLAGRQFATDPSQFSYLLVQAELGGAENRIEGWICRTLDELSRAIGRQAKDWAPLIVIELTNRAQQLVAWLSEAPVVRRGRRSN